MIPTALMNHPPTPGWDKATKQADVTIATRSGPRTAMTGLPVGDPISRLPPRASQKLHELRQERDELSLIADGEFDRQQTLIQDRMKAKARLDLLTIPEAWLRAGSPGEFPKPHDNSVIQAQAEYDRLSDQLETLQTRQKARRSRSEANGNLLRSVEAYAKSLGSDVVPFEMDPPELPPGELPINAVERMRQRRRELIVDLKTVDAAPRHSKVVKEMIRSEVTQLAEKGCPDVYRLIEGGSKIQWPQEYHRGELSGFAASEGKTHTLYGVAGGYITDSLPLLCFLFKDRMIEALEAEADVAADDASALSPDEKAQRSAAISAELLICERVEESFTELAAGAIVRRADLDPRAFLGIDGPDPRGD